MDLITVYQCLCERTRLRILNLLMQGPLCVCHVQRILREPQVKVSKHLGYLKARGLVEAQREGNWMVYSLPEIPSRLLARHLACLQDCLREEAVFQRDLTVLEELRPEIEAVGPSCCGTGAFQPQRRHRTKVERASVPAHETVVNLSVLP